MKYIFALIVLLNIPHKKLNVRLVSIKCTLYTDSEDLPQIPHLISYLYLISSARDNKIHAMGRQKEDLDFGSPHSSLHLAHSRMNSRQRLICGLKGGDNTGWDEVSINSVSLAKPNMQDNINKDPSLPLIASPLTKLFTFNRK